jgi:hypothetical protein
MTPTASSPIWTFFDHNFWITIVSLIAILLAYLLGRQQNRINEALLKIQDTVELYPLYDLQQRRIITNEAGKTKESSFYVPVVQIYNVGSRLIYLDTYTYNGKPYDLHGQVLPPAQIKDNHYWIELPMNGETHASIHVEFTDLDHRKWKTTITCDYANGIWKVSSLPCAQI